jgi:hypothetical protein
MMTEQWEGTLRLETSCFAMSAAREIWEARPVLRNG